MSDIRLYYTNVSQTWTATYTVNGASRTQTAYACGYSENGVNKVCHYFADGLENGQPYFQQRN